MKKVRLLLAGLLLAITAPFAMAQNITVSGTVTDESTGEPVPYASVQIKGTMIGMTTDELGQFSLQAPGNGTLVISFLGYKTAEVAINNRSVVDVVLSPDAEALEDAIVVGYGTAKKITSIVGSAATVNSKVMASRPTANAGDALQGQVAGLQIFSSTGEPMSNVSMRMRGVNSINASNTPLIILDGAPVSASIFTSLNSNDIESMTVMKDASSTAIYGSRAANGVIYITTKKGKRGEKPVVSVRGQYGISTLVTHKMDLMTSDQWFKFNEMVLGDQFVKTPIMEKAIENGTNFNWLEYFFNEQAPVWSVDASVSGSSDKSDYYFSVGAFDQTGTAPYSYLERYSVRSNINTNVNSWLKMGVSLGLTYQDYATAGFITSGNSWYNPVSAANWLYPWVTPYDDEGNERQLFEELGMYNTLYLQEIQPTTTNYIRVNGSMYQEINPLRGLTLRAQQSLEGYDYRNSYKALPTGPFAGNGTASESFSRYHQLTFTNTAEYKFAVADDHNFAILAGQEAIVSTSSSFGADVEGITDLRQAYLSSGTKYNKPSYGESETAYNSYFARVSYDFGSKYFLDASFRRDGSSLFGANKRYANFYSIGGMWDMKRENFMANVNWLNEFRVKASYGTTGNSGIGNYLSYGTIGNYGALYNGMSGWGVANPSNADLTWETVETLNIGFNGRALNFITFNVEFYNKMTRDMLMDIPYSYTTGHGSGAGNIGDMRNRGVDVEIGFDIIQTQDMFFNVKANFNYNANEITALFGGRDEFVVPNTGIKYQVGYPYGEMFYVRSAGVDKRDGMQMWYNLDGNPTKQYSDDYAVMTGKQRYAPWAGGVQLNFDWKGLYIGADFSWIAGKWTINNDRYFLMNPKFVTSDMNGAAELLNIWTTPGQETNVPGLNSPREFDDTLLENASFLRLKNLQISYTLPQKWIQKTGFLGSLRVYAIGRNLLTFTEYTGYDPEVDSNLQMGVYPNSKQYTVGVELTF